MRSHATACMTGKHPPYILGQALRFSQQPQERETSLSKRLEDGQPHRKVEILSDYNKSAYLFL